MQRAGRLPLAVAFALFALTGCPELPSLEGRRCPCIGGYDCVDGRCVPSEGLTGPRDLGADAQARDADSSPAACPDFVLHVQTCGGELPSFCEPDDDRAPWSVCEEEPERRCESPPGDLHLRAGTNEGEPLAGLEYEWRVEQPEIEQAFLVPGGSPGEATLVARVVGSYSVSVAARRAGAAEACALASTTIEVTPPAQGLYVELRWNSDRPDGDVERRTDEQGVDLDLLVREPLEGAWEDVRADDERRVLRSRSSSAPEAWLISEPSMGSADAGQPLSYTVGVRHVPRPPGDVAELRMKSFTVRAFLDAGSVPLCVLSKDIVITESSLLEVLAIDSDAPGCTEVMEVIGGE